MAKAQVNEIKAKSRMFLQEKRNIYDQISAAGAHGGLAVAALPPRSSLPIRRVPPLAGGHGGASWAPPPPRGCVCWQTT